MNNNDLVMNANPIVAYLQKPASEFTKADILRYAQEQGIKMVNFMYPGGDGKLKTLNFVVTNLTYLNTILTCGERVDGSSLFSFVQAGSSDLYVIPRFATAFLDPFAELPTLCMLCSFFDKDGRLLESAPEHTLQKACRLFTEKTGMEFHAMGELEYYVIYPDDHTFPAVDQHGYHESAPYAKMNAFRAKCMAYIAQTGGQIKYGHSEVGNFVQDGLVYEQNEIEFLPVRAEQAADQLMLAKWVIRNLAHESGLNVTFAPKITRGKAGSGLHIHMRIMKDGRNCMVAGGTSANHRQMTDWTFDCLKELFNRSEDIRLIGSAAIILTDVAVGRFGAIFQRYLMPWDYAASQIIIEEAGGIVRDFYGNEPPCDRPSSIIATANENMMKEMLEIFKPVE